MTKAPSSVLPAILGLQPYEWLTLLGICLGPIIAVLISFWIESRRKDREQKLIILRVLMTTRHLVGDPSYSAAINLIPVEFAGKSAVQNAYKEFIDAASTQVNDENREQISKTTAIKQTRLVYAVAKSMRFNIAETDIQTSAYAADSWITRDNIAMDSQKAMRDIATILLLQARLLVHAPLTPDERTFLGLPDEMPEN